MNAATFDPTPLVAGSLGTVMGSNLAGKTVSVSFDGVNSDILYNAANQINLLVPMAVKGKNSASMVVTVDGASSAPQTVILAPAWPAVFTHGVLNQDNSVNAAGAAGSETSSRSTRRAFPTARRSRFRSATGKTWSRCMRVRPRPSRVCNR